MVRSEYHLALPLAIDAVKSAPTPENYEYLRQCYIWLVRSTTPSDAVLQEVLNVPGTNDYWEKLAVAYAEKGNYSQAKALAERAPGAPVMRQVLVHLADWAMTQKVEVAKPKIPEELHGGLDTIQLAYTQYEKKQDDAARETLNAIGISSPWLEWKLLIRGLLAWSAGDNSRALDNWSRLQANRIPFRFAAPLRLTIDRSFVQSLKPQQLKVIQKQAGRLIPKINDLYEIREILGTEDTLTPAIEKTQRLLTDLRTASPDIPAKLTQLFYWEIVAGGQPQDMKLLQRYFPLPTEDQNYFRLQAMVMEQLREFDEAHAFWNKYQKWIEHTPSVWPPKQAQLARAMIYGRMGEAAEKWQNPPEPNDDMLAFFQSKMQKPSKRSPLHPTPRECYEKAAELAPDHPVAVLLLFDQLSKTEPARAKTYAQEIRNRFSHNLPVLKVVLKFYEQQKDSEQIKELIQQLAAIDPLDRQWQARLAQSVFEETWAKAMQGDGEALASLERAATRLGEAVRSQIKGLKTALAYRQGNAEAPQALLANNSTGRWAEFYAFIVESIRQKLPKKKWETFFKQLIEGITSTAGTEELFPLLELLGHYRSPDHTYRGYATQAKEISAQVLSQFLATTRTWEMNNRMARVLHRAELTKELKDFAMRHLGDFDDPWRLFFLAEADLMKSKTQRLTNRLAYNYWRANYLIGVPMNKMSGPHQYDKLKELIEERCRKTPKVREEMERGFY